MLRADSPTERRFSRASCWVLFSKPISPFGFRFNLSLAFGYKVHFTLHPSDPRPACKRGGGAILSKVARCAQKARPPPACSPARLRSH
ncbi:hypothetical protein EVAR_12755_1 [Eumeta japonica]|uniref:Uncharacterized protein n=1 Tax=Eumeta variegata TaxID=151549 RepID=A0A4C1UBZ8_EUMVA|nr:hypothetical protein EVAR_12755_1 [Eumeta japonica]